jgi:hypothetical protein
MMMKNNKPFSQIVFKLSMIAVLTVSLLSLGFYVRGLIENIKTDPDPEPEQTYTVTLNDYKVFQFMDVQYDFIMANVTITSNKTLNLSQNLYESSENINLDNTSEYTNYLQSQGYDLKCPLPESSTELTQTACLFIPVINRSLNELILKVSIDRVYNLSFNMNEISHAGTREMLGVEEPKPDYTATIIDKSLISIHSFYTLNENGDHEEVFFSSQSQIFSFQVTLENNTSNPLSVESTYIILDGKGTFQSVDTSYLNDELTPMIGLEFTGMKTAYLFMDITDETIDLYGLQNESIHVFIKLLNKPTYIEIPFMGSTQ